MKIGKEIRVYLDGEYSFSIAKPEDIEKYSEVNKGHKVTLDASDLEAYYLAEAKALRSRNIDKSLAEEGITTREQIVTTANATQLLLMAVSHLVVACSSSNDASLKTGSEKLRPFADKFLAAQELGDMPVDILGLENVAEKLINLSLKSGEIVKAELSNDVPDL